MFNKRPALKETLIFAVLAVVYFGLFAIPSALTATDNIRLIGAFNTDEALLCDWVQTAIRERTFTIPFYGYGHLYFNAGILPLALLDVFAPPSDQTIVVFYRLLSAAFSFGAIVVAFRFAQRISGSLTASASLAFMLVGSASFIEYSIMFHPDTSQVFFLLLGMYHCLIYLEENSSRSLTYSALAAGLAFSCKYSGILLLPIIMLVIYRNNRPHYNVIFRKLFRTLLLFLAAFGITSPALVYKLNFIKGMGVMFSSKSSGHWFESTGEGTGWFGLLFSSEFSGGILPAMAVIGLVFFSYQAIFSTNRGSFNRYMILVAWLLLYFVLLFTIKARFLHYLLPVFPFLVILATDFVKSMATAIGKKLKHSGISYMTNVTFALILIVPLLTSFSGIMDFKAYYQGRGEGAAQVMAGNWLIRHIPETQTVIYDQYSYVPPEFKTAHATWGMSKELLDSLNPDVILINRNIYGRYLNDSLASAYLEGRDAFMNRHDTYTSLLEGSSGYSKVMDFDPVIIFTRNQ